MKPVRTFIATPALPERLERLRGLALNLRWAWNHAALALFRRLDSDLWETSGHNPMLMLGTIDQGRLEEAASEEGFLSHMDGVNEALGSYMKAENTWYKRMKGPVSDGGPVAAYFSAEFGVTECLSIFAGGLGMLAGDHLKSASDLGVPLVGLGLLYQQGYFHQYLNEAGWQQEKYEDNDFHNLPIALQTREDGSPLTIEVTLAGRKVVAQVWCAQVGRVPLYLLDTNIPVNAPADRDITDQLYGGDIEMRIKQEIVLGIGGYRAIEALGFKPVVYHMNEGHSAFLSLERTRRLMETHRISFQEAREAASAGTVFTTHTPVAAGQDYFPPGLMDTYFGDYMPRLGLSRNEFLALGRLNPSNENEPFGQTILALRMAAHCNGVSRLHGKISRQMWQNLWPKVPVDEVPITHVTNGVHFRSWISQEMDQLYDRYLGHRWHEEPGDPTSWRTEQIPAEELWRTHERRKERMVGFVRRRLRSQLEARGSSQAEVEIAAEVLDPDALTFGFARRFATYKRATLILSNPDRLERILNNPGRPVQIVFAGKAHPADNPGKELIQKIIQLARGDRFRRRLVFLENYDTTIARYLVQGVDVWLNTPLRPLEASGTSGMKAAANGVLNLSTLDGWWDEAYRPEVGWAIGRGETYTDLAYQAQVEAEALYNLLEQDVVPSFYERGADGLPRRWISRMKASIQNLCYFFNTHRMVGEYTTRFYIPAYENYIRLAENELKRSRDLYAWKGRVRDNWGRINIESVDSPPVTQIKIGDTFEVKARIFLGDLSPDDVAVQLYMGQIDASNEIIDASFSEMQPTGTADKSHLFSARITPCCKSGMHGFTVRVLPRHPDLATPFLPGLITWA